jgi:serine protease Do
MKSRIVAITMGMVIVAAVGATVLLGQKVATPKAALAETPSADKQRRAAPHIRAHKMMFFGGEEGSWLGVSVSDVTSEKAKELKLPGEYGALVEDVREDSPAAKAGVQKGDVILQFAGEKVRSVVELTRLVHETPAGRAVEIEISRNGASRNLSAKIAEAPEPKEFAFMNGPHVEIPDVHVPDFDFNVMFSGGPRLGVSADELTPQLADYFGVKQGKGVLVREVNEGSAAQKAGLKAGDVIVKVGDATIASVGDLRKALRKNPSEKQQLTLTIVRDRKEQTVSVELEPVRQFIEPQEISELTGQIINPEHMRLLKDQIQAQVADVKKNSELMQLQKEKIRDEVERSMQQYRNEMEQLKKNYRKEIDQLRLQRHELMQEPI